MATTPRDPTHEISIDGNDEQQLVSVTTTHGTVDLVALLDSGVFAADPGDLSDFAEAVQRAAYDHLVHDE